MNNIGIFLLVITIYHTSAGEWNSFVGWVREDNDEINPPWWPKTTTRSTTTGIILKPSMEELIATCLRECPVTSEDDPVCGTDGVTYDNPRGLECAQLCGVDVQISRHARCDIGEDKNLTRAPSVIDTSTPEPEETTTPDKLTDVKKLMACMQQCALTSECLPVCGTDGVTYRNPARLLCAQYCGMDVRVKEFAPCLFSKAFTNCPSQPKIDDHKVTKSISPPAKNPVEVCVLTCPISKVYIPVCGSDGKTYNNVHELICAKDCGIDVWVKKQSACDELVTLPVTTTEEYDIEILALINPGIPEENLSPSINSSASPTSINNNPTSIDNSPTSTDNSSTSLDDRSTNIVYTISTDISQVENHITSTENSLITIENSPSTSTEGSPVTTHSSASTEKSTTRIVNSTVSGMVKTRINKSTVRITKSPIVTAIIPIKKRLNWNLVNSHLAEEKRKRAFYPLVG